MKPSVVSMSEAVQSTEKFTVNGHEINKAESSCHLCSIEKHEYHTYNRGSIVSKTKLNDGR